MAKVYPQFRSPYFHEETGRSSLLWGCLLVFQNPFGFFLPEETRGCSAWGRILKVWRSDSAVKTDLPVEFHARLLVWFRAFGFLP